MVNLLGNAIKYHDPAELDRWISIRVVAAEGSPAQLREWRIDVNDNGIGIPAEARRRTFDSPSVDDHASVDVDGAGLALARDVLR